MTPEEIRGTSDHGEVVAKFLREIAAQLSELNHILSSDDDPATLSGTLRDCTQALMAAIIMTQEISTKNAVDEAEQILAALGM